MLRRSFLCAFVGLLIGSTAVSAQANRGWKAGAAKVRITPAKLMWMSGYASRTRPAEGTLHDLWAKALVLENSGGQRCALVTLDLVGIPRALSVEVCTDLEKKYNLPRRAIWLSVSHTHTGPVVRSNLAPMYALDAEQQKRITDYALALHANIVSAVGKAIEALAPAEVSWSNGTAGFAVNRRNNKEKDVPELRKASMLKGPIDHQVPVLAVRDPKGKLKAVVFGYACHATVLSFYQWSGDYPGFTQIELEKNHPGAVALFWAGCGGDQNPLPRRTVTLAEKYGKELATAVDAVLGKPMKPITPGLVMAYREINLPFADLPSRDQLIQDTMSRNKYIAARARLLLEEIKTKGSLRGTYPYPVEAWQLGNGPTLVTLGGEVVVDYALRIKKELGPENTWVAGYSNDVMAYIPSLRVLKEGGYEGGGSMVYYGLPTVWSPRVEEMIVKAVHDVVKQVRSAR
jgi:Neutral/alkaline non-lysosomal ceramidase, N-terminal